MASGGETGYWPGFVDALSNMVMTLIIIIVLLNVALVYFFFKANKNTSQSVQSAIESTQKASAAEIESLQKENQRLNEELQQMREKSEAVVADQKPATPSKNASISEANKDQTATKQADKNQSDKNQPDKNQQDRNQSDKNQSDKSQADKNQAETAQAKQTQIAAAQANIETTQNQEVVNNQDSKAKNLAAEGEVKGAPQPKEAQAEGLVKDETLENSYNNKKGLTSELNKNNLITQSSNEMVIIYEDNNVEFSPATLVGLNQELGGLISKNKNIKIEILVEIVENKGYSFSRRLAYYRASSIRNFALTKGANPSRVVTKLVSATEGTQFPRAFIRVSP